MRFEARAPFVVTSRFITARMQTYLREIRPVLTLAVPIIIGQVSQMLMGVTDSVMLGWTGAVPLAASSFGGNVFGIFYVLGIGITLPMSVLVARARGAGREHECGEYLRHGLALAVVFGLVETLLIGALSWRLSWFGQPAEVEAIVTPFFLLIGSSLTPVLVYLVLRQFAEAMGRPWVPMFIMLGGIGLNILLNWIFIWGHWGVPAMGLTGAGISTWVSRTLGAVVIFVWLRRDPLFRKAWPERWLGGWSRARFGEMLKLGLPTSGMMLFESGAFAASAIMMGWLGAIPLAAHQIAISCAATTFMFSLGLSMATGMRISAAVGAGEMARVRPIGGASLGLGMLMMGVFALIFYFGGEAIAGKFIDDALVIALAAQFLAVAGLFQLADGGQVIGAAMLRGLHDVKIPAVITFVAYWVIAIPGGYYLALHTQVGAVGIWAMLAVGLLLAMAFFVDRFRRLTRSFAKA